MHSWELFSSIYRTFTSRYKLILCRLRFYGERQILYPKTGTGLTHFKRAVDGIAMHHLDKYYIKQILGKIRLLFGHRGWVEWHRGWVEFY